MRLFGEGSWDAGRRDVVAHTPAYVSTSWPHCHALSGHEELRDFAAHARENFAAVQLIVAMAYMRFAALGINADALGLRICHPDDIDAEFVVIIDLLFDVFPGVVFAEHLNDKLRRGLKVTIKLMSEREALI